MEYKEGDYVMNIFGREARYQRVSDWVVLTITVSCVMIGITAFFFSLAGGGSGFLEGIIMISLAVGTYILWTKKSLENMRGEAEKRELALDYDSAIDIWEELNEIEEAARVRKLKIEQGAMKVDQTVVQGDQITKTEIKDSVLNRSNIGNSDDDKIAKLEKIAEMKEKGLINDDDYEKMKREIVG